jgi:predicted transcriptional regulator
MYAVGELPIDNRPETVDYDLALETALRRMFDTGYTQIGVTREEELIGVLTYRSIVRSLLALGRLDVARDLDRLSVGTAVEVAHAISEDATVLALFDALAEGTYVAVEREGGWRILTDYDMLSRLKEAQSRSC